MPTISITYTSAEAQRFAAALGKAQSLTDSATPPNPRSATAAECKAFVVGRMKQLVIDVEGTEANRAALEAVRLTAFDPA